MDMANNAISFTVYVLQGAIRAMDTVNAVVKEKDPESDVQRFLTAGGSKVKNKYLLIMV